MITVRIEVHGTTAKVFSPYDARIIAAIKTCPGCEWYPSGRFWTVSASQARWLTPALEADGYRVIITDAPDQSEVLKRARKRATKAARRKGPAEKAKFKAVPATGVTPRAESLDELERAMYYGQGG